METRFLVFSSRTSKWVNFSKVEINLIYTLPIAMNFTLFILF